MSRSTSSDCYYASTMTQRASCRSKPSYCFPGLLVRITVCIMMGSFCSGSCHAYDSGYEDGMAHVMVGFNHLVASTVEKKQAVQTKAFYGPEKFSIEEFAATYNATITTKLQHTHAVALTLPKEKLALLEQDATFVQYMEWDPLVHYFGETVTWSTRMVGALSAQLPAARADQIDNEYCFKVCVVDAGVLISHPDIPYDLGSPYVRGTEIGVPSGQRWYNPVDPHGTHVAGIMLAQARNNIGIAGVIPDARNICLLSARVFDDQGTGQQDSRILEGVEWCADQGARVINLSLGALHSGTMAAQNVYRSITNRGVLIVSAVGNDGSSLKNYPAAFPEVIGVAAVDPNKKRATFSNYNDAVNIAAPGQLIYSTVSTLRIKNTATGVTYEAMSMSYAPKPNVPVTGSIVNVGEASTASQCAAAANKICLATRGTSTFETKALCCQRAGGKAIVIANNAAGIFAGSVGSGSVKIPVVSVSMADGQTLRSLPAGRTITLSFTEPGYDEISGTSMAAPHVAGVAARIWSLRPACTNEQVRQALYTSAEDLGNANSFGHGLVRTKEAYNALLAMPAPCGNRASVSRSSTTTNNSSSSSSNNNNNNRGGWSWGQTTWTGVWTGMSAWWGGEKDTVTVVEEQQVESASKRPSVGSLLRGMGNKRRFLRGQNIATR